MHRKCNYSKCSSSSGSSNCSSNRCRFVVVNRPGALSIDGCRLSVCPIPDPKSRTEGHSKLKIATKGAHYADNL